MPGDHRSSISQGKDEDWQRVKVGEEASLPECRLVAKSWPAPT
jgi:hypothetical protein